MMKRSFAEADFLRSETDRHKNLEALRRDIESFRDLDCPICAPDIDHYYKACSRITQLQNKMQVQAHIHIHCTNTRISCIKLHMCIKAWRTSRDIYLHVYMYICMLKGLDLNFCFFQLLLLASPQVAKALVPGRVVTLYLSSYRYTLAVILELNTRNSASPYTVLTLCKEMDESEQAAKLLVDPSSLSVVTPYKAMTELFHPDGVVKHTVVDISGQLIVNITDVVLSVEPLKMIDDYKKRQIPRFR